MFEVHEKLSVKQCQPYLALPEWVAKAQCSWLGGTWDLWQTLVSGSNVVRQPAVRVGRPVLRRSEQRRNGNGAKGRQAAGWAELRLTLRSGAPAAASRQRDAGINGCRAPADYCSLLV